MVTRTSIAHKLSESRDAGVRYLLSHQRDDGAVGDPESAGLGPYYKSIWAFAVGGEQGAGSRLATWVATNVQQPNGDFAGPLRGTMHDNNWSYPNAWMIVGAHLLGRYDVSSRGMAHLLGLQDPQTGGFRMQPGRDDSIQDVLNASQSGNACLLTGNLDAALNVAAFLRMVWAAQPRPDREQFFVFKPGTGLRTEFPEERQRLHSIRVDAPRQAYFNMGIAAAFLSRLAMETGDVSHAELARSYLEIGFHVLDEMYETAQVGKVGWGAALTYQVTGDDRYRQLAERVGDAMIAQQTDTGGWNNTGGFINDQVRIEVTAEFVVLLSEMLGGLAAR